MRHPKFGMIRLYVDIAFVRVSLADFLFFYCLWCEPCVELMQQTGALVACVIGKAFETFRLCCTRSDEISIRHAVSVSYTKRYSFLQTILETKFEWQISLILVCSCE